MYFTQNKIVKPILIIAPLNCFPYQSIPMSHGNSLPLNFKSNNGGLKLTKLKQLKYQGIVECIAKQQNESLCTCGLQYHVKKKIENLKMQLILLNL